MAIAQKPDFSDLIHPDTTLVRTLQDIAADADKGQTSAGIQHAILPFRLAATDSRLDSVDTAALVKTLKGELTQSPRSFIGQDDDVPVAQLFMRPEVMDMARDAGEKAFYL